MKTVNSPRPSFEPKLCPADVAWEGSVVGISLLAALGAAIGCLTDELAPSDGRGVAARLLSSLDRRWTVDEVRATALMSRSILLGSLVRLVVGVGLAIGRRWGFLLSGAVAALFTLGGLAAFPNGFGIAGAAYGALTLTYCVRRLRGQEASFFA